MNYLKKERLAELQEGISERRIDQDRLEDELADLALELNYSRDNQESREIMDKMSGLESEVRTLAQEIQTLKDRIHEL